MRCSCCVAVERSDGQWWRDGGHVWDESRSVSKPRQEKGLILFHHTKERERRPGLTLQVAQSVADALAQVPQGNIHGH